VATSGASTVPAALRLCCQTPYDLPHVSFMSVADAVEVQLRSESVADVEQVRVQVAFALMANASAFSAGASACYCSDDTANRIENGGTQRFEWWRRSRRDPGVVGAGGPRRAAHHHGDRCVDRHGRRNHGGTSIDSRWGR